MPEVIKRKILSLARKVLPKRNWVAGLFLGLFVLLGISVWVLPAKAGMGVDIMNGLIGGVTYIELMLAKIAIGLTVFFLQFFIQIAQYNNYIDAPTVKVGWIMVRDVANMFFVVVLLVIAIGTILGVEQYEWKKTLAKFILAAVFVNFSNLICGIFIDIAHVFTITFLNAVSATAGGNLISMFKFESMLKFLDQKSILTENLNLTLLAGASLALTFAALSMVTMGAYLVVMLARMVVLWVLIILSPLAYIFQVLPQTQSYAKQWWDKFGKQVLVAPVMVFFLWLTFATLGSGDIVSGPKGLGMTIESEEANKILGIGEQAISITEVSSWENMANFLVAMAFMIVGITVVQGMGVVGGGMVSKGLDFAKNVATIATGYAAGRWLVGAAEKVGKKGLGKAAWYAPWVGGEKWAMRGKILGKAIKGWYWGKGFETTPEADRRMKEIEEKRAKLSAATPEKRAVLSKEIKQLGEERDEIEKARKEMEGAPGVTDAQKHAKDEEKRVKEEEIAKLTRIRDEAARMTPEQEEALKKEVKGLEEELPKYMGGGFFGRAARAGVALEKQLAKTEKQETTRKQILWKRVGSDAGGNVLFLKIGMGAKGLGIGRFRIFGDKFKQQGQEKVLVTDKNGNPVLDEKGNKQHKPRYPGSDAQDRVERGWLQAEEMRSKAKDEEYEALGKEQVLSHARIKYNLHKNRFTYETDYGTMIERITKHKLATQTHTASEQALEHEAKLNLLLGKVKLGEGGFRVTVKDVSEMFDKQALAKILKDRVEPTEAALVQERISEKVKYGTDLDHLAKLLEAGLYAPKEQTDKIDVEKKKLDDINKEKDVYMKEWSEKQTKLAAIDKNLAENEAKKEQAEKDVETETDPDKKTKLTNLINRLNTRNGQLGGKRKELEAGVNELGDKVVDSSKESAEQKEELKMARGVMAEEADRLRDGDVAIAEKYYNETLKMAEEAGKDPARQADAKMYASQSEIWKNAITKAKAHGGQAWQYGVAKARQAESNRLYGYQHNQLLTESEQRAIWDKRGVSTPTNAMRELVEQMEKDFSQMSYEKFVANSGTMFLEMAGKASRNELTDADKAAMIGFFKRGFNESWIDDIIIGVMKNSESRAQIGSVLGWRDAGFSPDKIRDLQMFMATGRIDFTEKNVVQSEILDEALKGDKSYRMNVAQVIEGLRTGTFKNENGIELKGEDLGKLKENIRKRLKEQKRVLTKVQEELFDKVLLGYDESTGKLLEKNSKKRTDFVEDYLKTIKENQGTLEWFGNLRNEAIKNGHGENAGWAINHDVGGGEQIYIASGVRMARDHVYYDINKTDQYLRAKAHPHTDMNIAIHNGEQIGIGVREFEYKTMRGDITDANGYRGTSPRTIQFTMGLSSSDKYSDQRDQQGYFQVGHANATQEVWKDIESVQFDMAREQKQVVMPDDNVINITEGDEKQISQALSAMNVVKNVILPRVKINFLDFLMTSAVASGMSAYDGLKGKMRLKIPYFDKNTGKVKIEEIKSAGQFLEWLKRQGYEGVPKTFTPSSAAGTSAHDINP